jgi:PHD finger-like domain-containing protein 5A
VRARELSFAVYDELRESISLFCVYPYFDCANRPGDGICVSCSSFVNPTVLVHICDECNYGSLAGRCVICGNHGVTDAYYCRECYQLERCNEGCPKFVNLGATKTDLFYERKKYGFKKR